MRRRCHLFILHQCGLWRALLDRILSNTFTCEISRLRVSRIADDMVMVTRHECTCVFTFDINQNTGEVFVIGGRNCDKWPMCQFPIHLAMDIAQDEFDREMVKPNYQMLEATPEP